VREGEILGIAGVEGNGQEELASVLAGTLVPKSGSTQFLKDGKPLKFFELSPAARAELGLAVIPADRHKEGLVLELSLAENYYLRETVARDSRIPTTSGPFITAGRLEDGARESLKSFDVYPPEPERLAGELSGGNQQKVIIARELQRVPRLIVAHNPTRGLDLGATAAVQRRLLEAAEKHRAGVILISSDLDEILALSHTLHVLYGGRLRAVGTLGVTKEVVGRAMVGASE
jgi:simple sugar transport system ATP-binding protein